jgi:hypothetical protein
MALSNALPNPLEWVKQLSREPGEDNIELAVAWAITIGSISMVAIAMSSLAVFLGLGTEFAEPILSYTVEIGYIGEANVLVSLALAGGIAAVPYSMKMQRLAEKREILRDDANWIIGASALIFVLTPFQTEVPVGSTISLAFVIVGPLLGILYLTNVLL